MIRKKKKKKKKKRRKKSFIRKDGKSPDQTPIFKFGVHHGFAMTLPNVILCNETKTKTSASNDDNFRNVTLVVRAFRRNMTSFKNKNERKSI